MDKLYLNEIYIDKNNGLSYKLRVIREDHVELMYVKPEGDGHIMSMGINVFREDFKPGAKALLRARLGSDAKN